MKSKIFRAVLQQVLEKFKKWTIDMADQRYCTWITVLCRNGFNSIWEQIIFYARSVLLAAVLGIVGIQNTATGVAGDLIFLRLQINVNASTEEWLGSVLTNPFLCDRGNESLENAFFLLIMFQVSAPSTMAYHTWAISFPHSFFRNYQ